MPLSSSLTALRYLFLSLVFAPLALAAPASELSFARLYSEVKSWTLPNGLRVVFYRRDSAPIFAAQIWVGSARSAEKVGKTGISYMLQRLAFSGTPAIGTRDALGEARLLGRLDALMRASSPDDSRRSALEDELRQLWVEGAYEKLYRERGAVGLKADFGRDYTTFSVELPSSSFEFWAWMESWRILKPVFRGFYRERDFALRKRLSFKKYDLHQKMFDSLAALAFEGHSYASPEIGFLPDIGELRREDLEDWHRAYFRPDNMVVSIVGSLDAERVATIVERHFGRIPRGDAGHVPTLKALDYDLAERQLALYGTAGRRMLVAYYRPGYLSKDHGVFLLFPFLLASRPPSLLEGLLDFAILPVPVGPYDSLFVFDFSPSPSLSLDSLRDSLQAALTSAGANRVEEEHLAAAKELFRREKMMYLSSLRGLASSLAKSELLYGDWRRLPEIWAGVMELDAQTLRAAIAKYFRPHCRTTVMLKELS